MCRLCTPSLDLNLTYLFLQNDYLSLHTLSATDLQLKWCPHLNAILKVALLLRWSRWHHPLHRNLRADTTDQIQVQVISLAPISTSNTLHLSCSLGNRCIILPALRKQPNFWWHFRGRGGGNDNQPCLETIVKSRRHAATIWRDRKSDHPVANQSINSSANPITEYPLATWICRVQGS